MGEIGEGQEPVAGSQLENCFRKNYQLCPVLWETESRKSLEQTLGFGDMAIFAPFVTFSGLDSVMWCSWKPVLSPRESTVSSCKQFCHKKEQKWQKEDIRPREGFYLWFVSNGRKCTSILPQKQRFWTADRWREVCILWPSQVAGVEGPARQPFTKTVGKAGLRVQAPC